jgi:hypothetical protein
MRPRSYLERAVLSLPDEALQDALAAVQDLQCAVLAGAASWPRTKTVGRLDRLAALAQGEIFLRECTRKRRSAA